MIRPLNKPLNPVDKPDVIPDLTIFDVRANFKPNKEVIPPESLKPAR